jgi:hypothetical protein
MADDVQTTLVVVDGTGTQRSLYATVNSGTTYTFQSTPRVNGAQVDSTNPMPVLVKSAPITLVSLDTAIVASGGTAVTALLAGHRTAGGWISNPTTANVNLGINEVGVATGTTSSGNTTFITPGQTYTLSASANAVSVISSDSSHAFSGYGFQ